MSQAVDAPDTRCCEYVGTYENGVIRLSAPLDWADGTRVLIRMADVQQGGAIVDVGKVIIAGFGLAGRWIAEIFDRHGVNYTLVEQNPETVETQRKLGRQVVEGNIADPATLRQAGIAEASILALTIPDEVATQNATRVAKCLNPDIYIIGRTIYSSSGMKVEQLGADEIIKVEQVVARQFYEMLLRKLIPQ